MTSNDLIHAAQALKMGELRVFVTVLETAAPQAAACSTCRSLR